MKTNALDRLISLFWILSLSVGSVGSPASTRDAHVTSAQQDVLNYRESEYSKLQYIVSQGGTLNQTHFVGDGRYKKSFMRRGWDGQTVTLDKVVRPEQVFDHHALVQETDRDALDVVLRRTDALLNHLKAMPETPDLGELETAFSQLQTQCSAVAVSNIAQRKQLYFQACELRRRIAFSNPLLDFDKLLFVEFDYLGRELHMCSQFHGFKNDNTGGRMYILEDALGPEPRLRDLLENSIAENGPFQGKKLEDGIFLSPELSYDGRTVYFAWCAKNGDDKFDAGNSYHVFRVNSDGTGLRQLTFGPYNDFDPCELPGGRVVFLSTRRGAPYFLYLRCGGERPSYTLFSMKPDGGDIYPISYHETHEWHPSVDNNGMIVYTRWDYVDRASDIAHHFWYCFPDGRDPRAPHGNYPHPYVSMWDAGDLYSLPIIDGLKLGGKSGHKGGSGLHANMEMNIRAIPGSHKYVSTAAAHHGVAVGSLIMIDTRIEDDGIMSQVKRITPNCLFPETENSFGDEKDVDLWGRPYPDGLKSRYDIYYRTGAYATAWPLSEDFYLCNHWKSIILLDRFGNRIPLYTLTRDKDETSHEAQGFRPLDPMPFQPRPKPPVLADKTNEGEDRDPKGPKAVISVQNIYEMSPFPWPEGVEEERKIKWMRIVQFIPWIRSHGMHAAGFHMATARMSLGIVPVEEDGSVYCEAPIHKPIYFQALDENQMAIQSMKSVTYVHSGEHLSCLGCHEDKWKAIPPLPSTPLALQREPSELHEEFPGHFTDPTKGAVPFNYYLLAQPVLAELGYPTEYAEIHKRGWHPNSSSFSMPGKVGAHDSDLGKELLEKYKNGTVTEEQFHRLIMWLDCATMRKGWYNDTAKAKAGEVVWPEVDLDPANPLGVESGPPVSMARSARESMTPRHGVSLSLSGSRIVVHNPVREPVTVTIFSPAGRKKNEYALAGNENPEVLSPGNLPNGTFVIQVTSRTSTLSRMISVLHAKY